MRVRLLYRREAQFVKALVCTHPPLAAIILHSRACASRTETEKAF